MAEFENGYCTGCGYPAGRGINICGLRMFKGLHRPMCPRKTSMACGFDLTDRSSAWLFTESQRYWQIRSYFLVRRHHIYDWVGSKTRCRRPSCPTHENHSEPCPERNCRRKRGWAG